MNFTPQELSLPAPELFRLLRRQLLWATQEGEQLRAEAEVLEKKRKEEWIYKELIMENVMESELSKAKRKLVEAGHFDDPEGYDLMADDIAASKKLDIEPKADKLPWWREESWLQKLVEVRESKDIKESVPEQAPPPPESKPEEATPKPETAPETVPEAASEAA
jgi:hypothetical protein